MIYELYTFKPIFPGKTETEQLDRYIYLLGYPNKNFLDNCINFSSFDFSDSKMGNRCKYIKEFNIINKNMIDFICSCLEWVPNKRLSPNIQIDENWFSQV